MADVMEGEIDLDFGPGENLQSVDDGVVAYLVELSPIGNYRQALLIIGRDAPRLSLPGFAVGPNDEVYLAGVITAGTVDLDPGPGNLEVTRDPTTDEVPGFIIRIDPDGTFAWAHVFTWTVGREGAFGVTGVGVGTDGLVRLVGFADLGSGIGLYYKGVSALSGREQWLVGQRPLLGQRPYVTSSTMTVAAPGTLVVGGSFVTNDPVDFSTDPDREDIREGPGGFVTTVQPDGGYGGTSQTICGGFSPYALDGTDDEKFAASCARIVQFIGASLEPVWDWSSGESHSLAWAALAVGSQAIYATPESPSGAQSLVALDPQNGAELWNHPVPGRWMTMVTRTGLGLYALGVFSGEVDFNPGGGEDFHVAPENGGFLTHLSEDGTY